MSKLDDIRAASTFKQIIQGQAQHIGIAFLMTIGAISLLTSNANAPVLFGLTAHGWALTSITLALVHQFIVAMVFRLQLHKNFMTNLFGANDMRVWAFVFMPLLMARPVTLILVGWADMDPITNFRWIEIIVGVVLLVPALWAMHSTIVHFTIKRALGGDHFRDEIAAMPMVNKGAFAHTNNAMYGLAFLGLWAIALLFGSWNALVVALFQQSYIWIHMYCTEAPDMARIYHKNDS